MESKEDMGISKRKPWHLWLFGAVILLAYSIGVYDFIMIHSNNMDYIKSMDAKGDVVSYFTNYPLLLSILWGVNVFSCPIAAILLFARSKWAVKFALASAVSMGCLFIPTFGFMKRWDIFGPLLSIIDITVLLVTIGFFFYCRRMAKIGILK